MTEQRIKDLNALAAATRERLTSETSEPEYQLREAIKTAARARWTDFDIALLSEVIERRTHRNPTDLVPDLTAAEVASMLRDVDLTEVDLAGALGPQWCELLALADTAPDLDDMAVLQLALFNNASEDPENTRDSALGSSWWSAKNTARERDQDSIRVIFFTVAQLWRLRDPYMRYIAMRMTREVVAALSVRDLVGLPDMLTQAEYDLLTRPWAIVVGRVHPDDRDRLGEVV